LLLSQPALFVKNMYTHTYMYVVGILIWVTVHDLCHRTEIPVVMTRGFHYVIQGASGKRGIFFERTSSLISASYKSKKQKSF
jgi:hypothetical protein